MNTKISEGEDSTASVGDLFQYCTPGLMRNFLPNVQSDHTKPQVILSWYTTAEKYLFFSSLLLNIKQL